MPRDVLHGPLRYFGGKGGLLNKLLPIIPAGGDPYVEPYAGSASVFFARDRAESEVLNDLNSDVINLLRCLKEKRTFYELKHRLLWTLYSRAEYIRAIEVLRDDGSTEIDRAWALFVAQNMVTSAIQMFTPGRWGRTFTQGGGVARTVSQWLMRLSMLDGWHWRLAGVKIENRDALDVIMDYDSSRTVFYIDPPYLPDARSRDRVYKCDQDEQHHKDLLDLILSAKGAIVISGYDSALYKVLDKAGWKRFEWNTVCSGAARGRGSKLRGPMSAKTHAARIEVAWVNPKAQQMIVS
ncbi:MAG: hypothetical protein KatS3mg054_0071 [Chloroflexus sp.]|nr:MAG: hypothetical protein KatS3mg054_0071 [Chloroflexus sp.]